MSQMLKIRLGTRGSQLALWQSQFVKTELEKLSRATEFEVELVILQTAGDVTSGPLKNIGGQGLFTKRLQQALLENEIDFAVHSLKDLPTLPEPGLQLTAVPPRADTRDVLVAPNALTLETLKPGSRIGTGSTRRRAQLLFHRRDLEVLDIRGNLDTRISKAESGEYDAIVLAKAGLDRLGWADKISFVFETDVVLPAVGQGALGIESRVPESNRDRTIVELLKSLTDPTTEACVLAERKMMRTMEAGCLAPVGAVTHVVDGQLSLTGVALDTEGTQRITASEQGPMENAQELGRLVADSLLAQGAEALINEIH